MKIKPPSQAQERFYSSHRESIGKALSSPGIRSNKKTHINCGSSARMAGNVCANVDQIRRQGRWNIITINGAHLTNLPREWWDQWQASPHMVDSFILHVPPLTHLRASARSCSRRSANDMTHWRRKNSFLVIMMFRKTFIQDSVLMMERHLCYPIWQHSFFCDPAYLSFKKDMPQIEAQEHDPADTLLQQRVPMH
ncbi:hypothetical protein [Absidia glauca]|uniref:Ndc10 domain-containing protein n=1 Tax=Absidia glauca TaxID=4829 RepID=A0A163JLT4_ABSGL|nr:hypothetical protein [Absidia glauca]